MADLYSDIGEFERRYNRASQVDSNDQLELLSILKAASRELEGPFGINRKLYASTRTRSYNTQGGRYLELGDDELVSVTTLKVDTDNDRVYETTLVEGTDFELANEDDDNDDQPPFGIVRLLRTGTQIARFPNQRRSTQIVGRFGYADTVEALLTSAGAAVTGSLTGTTGTALTVTGSPVYPIAPGVTLKIESEEIYVRDGRSSPYVVDRGVNGTTAAAHAGAALYRKTYESDGVEAMLLMASRVWKRKETPILPVIAAPGVGSLMLSQVQDPDVQALIARLKRYTMV